MKWGFIGAALLGGVAFGQGPVTISITSVTPNANIHPSDVVRFTVNLQKTPAPDTRSTTVVVKLMETINTGQPREAVTASSSFSSTTGLATVTLDTYQVPDLICGSSSSGQKCNTNPASLSDLIQNVQLQITATATTNGSTTTAPPQTIVVLPATASLSSNTQPLNTTSPVHASLSGTARSDGSQPAITLLKSSGATGCSLGTGYGAFVSFKCYFQSYSTTIAGDGHSFDATVDTTVQNSAFRSEENNISFIGGYDVVVQWYENLATANGIQGGNRLRQAFNPAGFTVTAQPKDDAISVTKVTGMLDGNNSDPKKRTPFTWVPGQTPVLNAAPGTRITVTSVEGTYRLSKYSQAIIFPVLKANGHLYGVGYSYVKLTYGKDKALMDYGHTPAGSTYVFIDLPADPITSFEFLLYMSPPDEKITDFTGSNVVDYIATRSFAKSTSIAGTGAITADLMITNIYPVQAIQSPNEHVTLISGKQAVARVFIKSVGPSAQPVGNVTATLRCSNASDPGEYHATSGTSITAQTVATAPSLGAPPNPADQSIDFIIPAPCTKPQTPGTTLFTAEIVLPPGVTDTDLSNNSLTRPITFVPPPGPRPFKIGWVKIPYKRPSQDAAATAGDVSDADAFLRALYPVPENGVRYFPLTVAYQEWKKPLVTADDWSALVKDLSAKNLLNDVPIEEDFDQVVGWVQSLPASMIAGVADAKWAGGPGTAVTIQFYSKIGGETTLVHEIGHNLGLRHTNDTADGCTFAEDKGTGWPFPNPTIQSYGYDFAAMRVVPPTKYDFMSYCPDETLWISPYSSEALYQAGLSPTRDPVHLTFDDLPKKGAARAESQKRSASPQDLWLVTGSARADGSSAQLDPFIRTTSSRPPNATDPNGNYCLAFTGTSSQFCFTLPFVASEGGGLSEQAFNFLIPVVPNASGVTLTLNGQTQASLSAQPNLSVSIVSPQAGDRWQGSSQTIRWTSNGGSQTSYAVQYSYNGGTSWLTLATKLTDTQVPLDSSRLQGGDQVLFRVLAGAGVSTAAAQVGPITIVQAPRIAVAAPLFDLHSVVATQSSDRSFTISNTGSGPLRITALVSSDPQFVVISPALPTIVMGGDSAALVIRFLPAVSGDVMANLRIESNDAVQPVLNVSLKGKGVSSAAPEIAVDQTSLDFGAIFQSQSNTQTITVTNFGAVALNVLSIDLTGPFALSQNPAPFTLLQNQTQALTIQFAPTAVGAASGTITIRSNDLSRASLVTNLTGSGLSPGNVKLPTLRAGTPVVNGASFTVGLTRGALGSIFGNDLADGTLTQTNTPWATQLAGAKVMVAGIPAPLYFVSPTQINFQVPFEAPLGSVTIVVSRDGFQSAAQQVTLSDYAPGIFQYARTATSLDPIIVHASTNQLVSPTSLPAANEALVIYATGIGRLNNAPVSGAGSPSSPLAASADPVTVTLSGTPVSVLFAGLTPGYVGLVQINIQLGSTLPTGSCAALVIRVAGVVSPTVNLATGAAGCTPVAAPALSLSSNTLAFGTVTTGASADRSVTLQNTGAAPLNVSALNISGTGFSIVSPAAPFSVPPGASQAIALRFRPSAAGAQNGTLTILSNDPKSPSATVALSGTGAAPAAVPVITASPATLDFGIVAAGQTKDLSLTVNNTGNAVLTVSSATSSNARFALASVSAVPFNVGQGSFQFLTIRFSPTAAGLQTGTLTLASNDPATPSLSVALTGTGSGGTTGGTGTITVGQTVTGTLSSTSARSVDCNTCYADHYTLVLGATQRLTVTVTSSTFAPYLQILDPGGNLLALDSNPGGLGGARIVGTFTAGTFVIEVTTVNEGDTGTYTLTITPS